MLLLFFIIYGIIIGLLIYLICLYLCNFDIEENKVRLKITRPRYKKLGNKKYANFAIIVIGKHTAFFSDFPLVFRFYSEDRFKSKVRISYSLDKSEEEIFNKILIFEKNDIEVIYPITDIIPSEIYLEIEVDSEYGYPKAFFEIRENKYCDISTDLTMEIIFPK